MADACWGESFGMHKITISISLLCVSLILLIAERIQEIVFGGAAALVMSIIVFVVSRKVPSKIISILLFVNGGLAQPSSRCYWINLNLLTNATIANDPMKFVT